MDVAAARAEIEQLERARGAALIAQDWDALAALIADDIVHVHGNGTVESKQGYLANVRKLRFLRVERSSLSVRMVGDMAIATGVLDQSVRPNAEDAAIEVRSFTTQCWARRGDGWVQETFHSTLLD